MSRLAQYQQLLTLLLVLLMHQRTYSKLVPNYFLQHISNHNRYSDGGGGGGLSGEVKLLFLHNNKAAGSAYKATLNTYSRQSGRPLKECRIKE